MKKKSEGITLIALVITIIILLILAGISIATLTNTGLFGKAKEAKQKAQNAKIDEEIKLSEYENSIITTRNSEENKESEYIKSLNFSVIAEKNKITLTLNTITEDPNKILGYHYFIKDENNQNVIKARMDTSKKITIDGLSSNTKYNVTVIAYDINNNYKKSETQKIQTLSAPVIEITSVKSVSSINKNTTATVEDVSNVLFDGNIKNGRILYRSIT